MYLLIFINMYKITLNNIFKYVVKKLLFFFLRINLIRKRKTKQGQFRHFYRMLGAPSNTLFWFQHCNNDNLNGKPKGKVYKLDCRKKNTEVYYTKTSIQLWKKKSCNYQSACLRSASNQGYDHRFNTYHQYQYKIV